eukprot:TRINITY_DN4608_c0_g1_i1.p1 TRINITY_DN4608_c0_g1~~TRINITY_DN4608_c0_g1_i1.p1  ORF type:complete len:709 (-),score=131.05 TRINITY_DN4608_c0_g1_i1:142-2268(-)
MAACTRLQRAPPQRLASPTASPTSRYSAVRCSTPTSRSGRSQTPGSTSAGSSAGAAGWSSASSRSSPVSASSSVSPTGAALSVASGSSASALRAANLLRAGAPELARAVPGGGSALRADVGARHGSGAATPPMTPPVGRSRGSAPLFGVDAMRTRPLTPQRGCRQVALPHQQQHFNMHAHAQLQQPSQLGLGVGMGAPGPVRAAHWAFPQSQVTASTGGVGAFALAASGCSAASSCAEARGTVAGCGSRHPPSASAVATATNGCAPPDMPPFPRHWLAESRQLVSPTALACAGQLQLGASTSSVATAALEPGSLRRAAPHAVAPALPGEEAALALGAATCAEEEDAALQAAICASLESVGAEDEDERSLQEAIARSIAEMGEVDGTPSLLAEASRKAVSADVAVVDDDRDRRLRLTPPRDLASTFAPAQWLTDASIAFVYALLCAGRLRPLRPSSIAGDRSACDGVVVNGNADGTELPEAVLLIDPATAFWLANERDAEHLAEARQALKLDEKDLILCPVNDNMNGSKADAGTHWSLLACHGRPANRRFIHYDSCSARAERAQSLAQATALASHLAGERTAPTVSPCAQQDNSYDCGVYVLAFTHVILDVYLGLKGSAHEVRPQQWETRVNAVTPREVAGLRSALYDLLLAEADGVGSGAAPPSPPSPPQPKSWRSDQAQVAAVSRPLSWRAGQAPVGAEGAFRRCVS